MLSDKVVPPGGEAEIKTTFNTRGYRGRKTKSITVTSNDPLNTNLRLRLMATVEVELALEPESIYFGRVRRGVQHVRRVKLVGKSVEKTKILGIQQADDARIRIRRLDPTQEQDQALLEVTMPMDLPVGRFFEKTTVQTDDEKVKQLTLTLRGEILGDISWEPRNVQFGYFPRDQFPARTLTLSITGGKKFRVLRAYDSAEQVTAKVNEVKPGESYTLDLRIEPKTDTRTLRGELVVVTDYPGQEEIRIRYYGGLRQDQPEENP